MPIDPDRIAASRTAQLCIRGTEEELRRDLAAARRTYAEAWESARTDLDRCIAAHYVGHLTEDLESQLEWHRRALDLAARCDAADVTDFHPSLHACLGRTLRALGRVSEAAPFEQRARDLGFGPE